MPGDNKNLLVFGMGYSATAIASTSVGEFSSVVGTTRSVEKKSLLQDMGFEHLEFSGHATPDISARLGETTHLLISIAPSPVDPVLKAFANLVELADRLEWIGYLSTVGVYGNHDGQWVDEETEVKPVSDRSIARVKAETAWQMTAKKKNAQLAIFRLSGIYGPGRNAFVFAKNGKSRRLVKPGQVFNRIHRDDIATAVNLAMETSASGVFNITDDLPAPPQDVVTYAHEVMGREPPPVQDFETAELSPMARSFYGENKRVSNHKSKEVLGLEYAWPNYKFALRKMWDENSWQ